MARRDLIELIGQITPERRALRAFRSASPGYSPLSGEGARIHGGRWNPPQSFPVVYLATDVGAAAGEVLRTATKYGLSVEQLLPRILWTVDVDLDRVLDFTDPMIRDQAHLPLVAIADHDLRICQAYGDAAHYLGIEAILSPSNTGAATTVAMFVNRLGARSAARVISEELLDRGAIT